MPDAQPHSSDRELQKRWDAVLGMVEVQIDNQADFNAYLADSVATSLDGGVLRVTVRNGFVAAWIRQRVMPGIRRFAAQVFGSEISIALDTMAYTPSDVLVREGLAGDYAQWADVRLSRHRDSMARENARTYPSDPNCTFDRFEVSVSNARALNAARRVVENPGNEFNPLTIASDTGQGKTHLLNAIANEMRKTQLNVVCLTGEEFVDSFVKSSQAGRVAGVRDRYRGADVLLVDGIEQLISKEKTQTFFLAVLEHLISNQKQVVVTFNTAYQIVELADEITSRLTGGLEVRIGEPDFHLMRAVVLRYATERGLGPLASHALDYLQDVTVRNVREIIGGIARVGARTKLGYVAETAGATTISREIFEDAWRDRISEPDGSLLPPDTVFDAVATVFNLSVDQLRRPGRGNRSLTSARDVTIYLLRDKCGLTSSETGVLMGGRPHSTILAALTRYSERRKMEPQLIEAERRVERLLR